MPPSDSSSVDIKGLKLLYSQNSCARILLDYASSRTKNSKESKVVRLMALLSENESNFSRRELINVLKQLEHLGAGEFLIGRRGQPSRFQWTVAMAGLGKAAKGMNTEIESLNDVEAVDEDDDSIEISTSKITHVYKLRPDFEISFDLPLNLSPNEATRLANFIKTLPFDDTNDA